MKELPRVYGIPKKDATKTITAIVDTLSASAIMDPWNLHSHIKDFAPNANDRHLESIINKVFDQLQEEGYLPRDQEGYQPRYDRRRRTRREYRPGYAPTEKRRERRRYDDEEDYEDEFRFWRDAAERRREEEHELRMKRLEAEILKITRETRGSRTPQGAYEEVREFIDAEGNLCDPEKAVSVRMKRIPMETRGGLTSEQVRRIMREEREQLTPGKIRDIVRTEVSTREEPLTAQGVERIVRKITAEEKEELTPERVRDIFRSERAAGAMTAEGVLATAIQEAGRVVGQREPVKIIIEGAKDLLTQPGMSGTMPPSYDQPLHPSRGVMEELRKHGLVTRIIERGRNLGSGSSSNPGVRNSNSNPELLKQIREKGVLTVLEENFPRVKEIRETRILGRSAPQPEPKGKPVGEKEGEPMADSMDRSLESIYIHSEAI